jgi:cytochrome c peroxidase
VQISSSPWIKGWAETHEPVAGTVASLEGDRKPWRADSYRVVGVEDFISSRKNRSELFPSSTAELKTWHFICNQCSAVSNSHSNIMLFQLQGEYTMTTRLLPCLGSFLALTALVTAYGAPQSPPPASGEPGQKKSQPGTDAIEEAQTPKTVQVTRPEQKKSKHDLSDHFKETEAPPSSPALQTQPEQGKMNGFEFYRDPLGSKQPGMTLAEIMKMDIEAKPKVMAKHLQWLEQHFNLQPSLDPEVKMSRGKPLPVGPTAKLAKGMTWEKLAELTPEQIRSQKLFPYPTLPHPKHNPGGQVFPKIQLAMFPRLERFDVDFDLPDAFIPEFPPAMFLRNRPELGDVSRGEVVSINNYYRLFKDILTPVQLDGLRLLLTPLPQEEFNPTDDRKSVNASLGVTCFDCHVNGHTTAQFHLNPDDRPQHRRFRLDTVSLRGVAHAQLHGSMRSLRSVEDFTEFEQRTAYFNGDPIHAMKKGFMELSRVQVSHMAQMQNMLDFPPAPKLNHQGRLDAAKASEAELRGEKLFFGKAKCGDCHPAPFYLDNQHHDLKLERFLGEPPQGQIKTFSLRGIKDSPPYLHDGRLFTLEDTVEFFNLIFELRLEAQEKKDLVTFMRAL